MEWVTLRDDEFYQRMQIELVRDEAVEIDTQGKAVTLKSGRKISYDKLLLAPGSEPSRLPIEGATLPHVKTLRTLADAQAIIDRGQPRRAAWSSSGRASSVSRSPRRCAPAISKWTW